MNSNVFTAFALIVILGVFAHAEEHSSDATSTDTGSSELAGGVTAGLAFRQRRQFPGGYGGGFPGFGGGFSNSFANANAGSSSLGGFPGFSNSFANANAGSSSIGRK